MDCVLYCAMITKHKIMDASVTIHAICGYLILTCLVRGLVVSSQTLCSDYPVSTADSVSPSQGENLTLFCTVGYTPGISTTNVTWSFQDDTNTSVILDSFVDERIALVEEVSQGCFSNILHVSFVAARDSGTYWCSDGVNSSAIIMINVRIPFNFSYPICSVNGAQDILAEAGEVVELACEAPTSNPPWLLQWQRTMSGSTATVGATISTHEGIHTLTASVTISADRYHGAILDCIAYCPYFPGPESDQCGGYVQSSCKLDSFYVTDVPLENTFYIAPVDQSVVQGASMTFFCTTILDSTSDGPTVQFILSTNRSVEHVSIPNGHALVLSGITISDNGTTIGCGLFFKGKRYRVKYSTIYVTKPLTTTVDSTLTTLMSNKTNNASEPITLTSTMPNIDNSTLSEATTESVATPTDQWSSTSNQSSKNDTIDYFSSSTTTEPISLTSGSQRDSTTLTEDVLSVSNRSSTATYPTPDTNEIHREQNQGPSPLFIGLIAGCSAAALLLIIVLIIVGKTISKSKGHRSSWSPKNNTKTTYRDYRDRKKRFRLSVLSGKNVSIEGSFDIDEDKLDKL